MNLQISKREKDTKTENLRTEGRIPAVFYGKKVPSTSISVDLADFIKVWKEAGESTVISLEQEGEDEIDVLIYGVQTDPVSETPIHADFYAFEKGQKLEVGVSMEFVGVSPAVKDLGGTLVKVIHELQVEAEPKNLPHSIEVDISALKEFGDQIVAGDITLPEGVELKVEQDEVIALAEEPKEEEEPEPVGDVDFSEIEVEGEKKGEEDSEEGDGGDSSTKEEKKGE